MENITLIVFDGEPHLFDNIIIRVSLIIMYSIVFIFCFVGNLAVVLVTILHRKMKTRTKFSLGNLAFANWCVGIFCIYQNLSLFLVDSWMLGVFFCKMYHFVNNWTHTASILIFVVNALERYMLILHPFHCRRYLTNFKLKLLILFVWLISAVLCSPRLYYMQLIRREIWASFPPDPKETPTFDFVCAPYSTAYDFRTSDLIHFILLFLLPLLTISTLYVKLALHLWRQDYSRNFLVYIPIKDTMSKTNCAQNGKYDCSTLARDGFSTCPDSHPKKLKGSKKVGGSEGSCLQGYISPCNFPTCTSCKESYLSRKPSTYSSSSDSDNMTPGPSTNPGKSRVFVLGEEPSTGLSSSNTCCGGSRRAKVILIRRPHKTVIRLLITVVVTFAVCNFPYHLRKLYQNYASNPNLDSNLAEFFTPITYLLMYAHCAISPFIYGFMSKTLQKCLRDFVCCKLRAKPPREI